MASHLHDDPRVQDAYSLRCAPQVHGAARDTLTFVEDVCRRELDSAIDNPMVLPDGRVSSNGNFHGAPLGYAADFLAIALADVGSMAERRTDRQLDARRSQGLPPFLAHDPGVDSGLMIAQYTAAALVAENKRLAAPASVDSIPTSAMQEDHVSMGWAAARKLRKVVDNLRAILAIEMTTAAASHRAPRPLAPAPATAAALGLLRASVPGAGPDRWLAPELETANQLWLRARWSMPSTRRSGRSNERRRRAATGTRAPRGVELSCANWQLEAPMRMLMNNLDPEVAERPDDLVVYGGTGRAARSWAAFDAMVATLQSMRPFVSIQTYGLRILTLHQDPQEVQTGANAFLTVIAAIHALHFTVACCCSFGSSSMPWRIATTTSIRGGSRSAPRSGACSASSGA